MNDILKKRVKKILGVKNLDLINKIFHNLHEIRLNLFFKYHFGRLIILNFFFMRRTILNRAKPRNKRHVLFVTEKWFECNPMMGRSNTEHNLLGSLEASGLATQDQFHYDEYCLQYHRPCDAALLQLCMETEPDILIFSQPDAYAPRWETFGLIRKRLGIPVVVIWWDFLPDAESILQYVDLNIVLQSVYLKETSHPEKYLLMWTPQDPRIYYNPNLIRDINISFIGDKNKPDRLKGICALNNNSLNVYLSGGMRDHRLTSDEYAHVHMRSKIALNFSGGGFWSDEARFRVHHAKGRIFESTLCGAMLLESDNPETKIWFEPMVDYVPFSNETDLIEKVKYYLEHDVEREIIAANGYQKAKKMYNCEKFWMIVFAKIFDSNFA